MSQGLYVFAEYTSEKNHFFHWRLEFPEVFQKGGFDCVLGNPPWEVSQLSEEEFFESRASDIAQLAGSQRKQKILELKEKDKILWDEYENAKRKYEVENVYYRNAPQFQLTARGKINTYALFSEIIMHLRNKKGRAGFIVPTGIATDDSTKHYFMYISTTSLVSLYSFENETFIFPEVHHSFKFSLISLGESKTSDLAFFLRDTKQLDDRRRHFTLSRDEFMLFNPNTQTCPIFRSEKDAELTKKIYCNVPILIQEKDMTTDIGNPWKIHFKQGLFNMTIASHLFHTEPAPDRLPLYEAKMMHQFDHRWATYIDSGETVDVPLAQKQDVNFAVRPRYWVDKNEVLERIAVDDDNTKAKKQIPKWLMGWRDITNPITVRTVIMGILSHVGVGNTIPLLLFESKMASVKLSCLYANFNSLILDYIARQKIGGTHLNFFYVMQFPVLPPHKYSHDDIDFIVPRVLELTYTATDLIPFAEDLWDSADRKLRQLFLEQRYGEKAAALEEFTQYDTTRLPESGKLRDEQTGLAAILPPFVFDPSRRSLLRAGLDARYARLYGLTRDDLRYILDPADLMGPDYPSETFRVLKEKELAEYGEYRTRRLVLEAWDRGEE